MLAAARHVDVHVLARQEHRCVGGRVDVEFEHDRRVVVRLDLRDGRREPAVAGLARRRRRRHRDHAVALRHHLARQHEAFVLLVLGQRVVDVVVAEVVAAAFRAALAGAAYAVRTIHRQVDARAKCRIEHLLAGLAFDEARDAILEVQCNLVAGHGTLLHSVFDIRRQT